MSVVFDGGEALLLLLRWVGEEGLRRRLHARGLLLVGLAAPGQGEGEG